MHVSYSSENDETELLLLTWPQSDVTYTRTMTLLSQDVNSTKCGRCLSYDVTDMNLDLLCYQ